jgi:hypothetical protein
MELHRKKKDDFLTKLVSFCNVFYNPYIIGGDFNILRHRGEKNKPTRLSHSYDIFNRIIHTLGLREIQMSRGNYTCSNRQVCPTLKKLDRVLMSPGWESFFPLIQVRTFVVICLIIIPFLSFLEIVIILLLSTEY